jgi:hypothetical protein
MPNIVTFDTTRLLIIEIPVHASPMTSPQTLLDNVTSMQEIYSEWKEFVAKTAGSPASGGLGFPPAIRQVAGDPITDTQNLGITYFVTNGWRFKPAEGNHKWTVDGNVWTDPPGQSVFVPTDGPFTVNTETKVSNLVDGLTNINTSIQQVLTDTDLISAIIAGDAVVSSDDLTVTIFESESPIPSPRTIKAQYSISADGRIRFRLI